MTCRAPGLRSALILFLLPLFLVSCDPRRVYEEHQPLKEGVWHLRDKKEFTVEISDPGAQYNVYLDIRNDRDYAFSNLYLFLNTGYPDGTASRDTVELTLADYDGRWLGSGMGSVKFSRFLLQKGLRFGQLGTYRFVLEQAMRTNELRGIRDVGIRIEKQK